MLNAIKKAILFFFIVILAIVLFIVIFPLAHKPDIINPAELDITGEFLQLDDGLRVHYMEKGKGDALLLIHGFTANLYTWNEIMPELSKKYRVIAIDLLGYGFTDKPKDATYNYQAFSDVIKKFLDKKGVKKVSLTGNSMGGGAAIRFALDHPEMVNKLILVDSAGVKFEHNPMLRIMFGTPGLNNFVFSMVNDKSVKKSMAICCYFNDDMITDERAHLASFTFRTEGALNSVSKTVMQNEFDGLEEELGNLKAPTLIIWGEKDMLIPATAAGKFNRMIPNSKLVMIEKCGHMPQEEKPAETIAAIVNFLK